MLVEQRKRRRFDAIAESFKIISNSIVDRENREELRTIKDELDRLEGGTAFDIFA